VMILVVTFVGTLIHIYSTGYMAHDARPAAYFGYLNLFTGAMLILVLAANLPVMFIGWEGVGLCSYLLIGFWYERDDYAYAGRKAFIVNRIGDFAFLLGMFLLFWAVKSLDFADLKSPAAQVAYGKSFWGGERLAAAAGVFLFIGACGKSAQIPLYVWLPDAMAGPTPVSALIHAATMVTAGVYMVCRMSYLYAASTTALIVVSTVGLLTALVAAFMAFAQTDLKKVLAYSTVSQLGFMFVAAGTGNWVAAIFHLGTHAFFKACLFLGAGSVMHGMEHGGSHTPGDITTMGGLRKHMPITRWTFLISCLAISGIFPFAGFFSKDEILGGAWAVMPPDWPIWYGKLLWAGLVVAALGTSVYMWRLYFLVFGGEERSDAAKGAHESPFSMTGPLVVLAFLATVAGIIGMPHLKNTKLPPVTHALASWLEPSVSQSWYEPRGVPLAQNAAPDAPCCCIVGPDQVGDLDHGHMTTRDCAERGGKCARQNTKECAEEAVADPITFGLMGLALLIGAIGIGIAWSFYGRGPTRSLDKLVDGPLQPAYQASKNKLWVDEIYDAIIVRPFKMLARGLLEIVDKFVIDTVAVNGSAFVVGLFGRVSRWFQNGQVQRYLTGLVLGAAFVFLVSDCKTHPTFRLERTGDSYHAVARPGEGILSSTSTIAWDITGDGQPDRDPQNPDQILQGPQMTVRSGDITADRITMIIADSVSRETIRVTRKLSDAVDVQPPPPPPAQPTQPVQEGAKP